MPHTNAFLDIVNDAKTRIQETNVAQTQAWIDQGETFRLVDTREDREWIQGHLPNAIHLSKGVIERDVLSAIPNKNDKIVLYCGGGYRSALAADNLQKMGYTNVWSMDGGVRGWVEANLPMVTDA